MKTINIHQAKTQLSRLIEEVVAGEPFLIAKAGKPMVKVAPLADKPKAARRLGFMAGQFTAPDDFDTMFADDTLAGYGSSVRRV